ncbi:MAG TPA: IclR family transcriptional regulator [Croceicoccus sp.]|nr:IclR family transcriptional regulator [Croceicoccus sp.]
MVSNKPSSGAAERTLDIIEAVAQLGVSRISAIADRTRLPESTVHRIVARLVARGYFFSPRTGHYMVGHTLHRIGHSATEQSMMAERSRPLLQALNRKTGLHTHFGILQGEMVSYLIICVNGQHPISPVEGTQLEAYCSGIGKALIANETAEKRAEYLSRNDFVAITPNTITDPAELDRHLTTVRESGFALDDEEIVPGLRCVAVPVFNRDQHVAAAISASGPAHLVTGRKVPTIRAALSRITQQLADQTR